MIIILKHKNGNGISYNERGVARLKTWPIEMENLKPTKSIWKPEKKLPRVTQIKILLISMYFNIDLNRMRLV